MKFLNLLVLTVLLLQSNLSFAKVGHTEIQYVFKKLQYQSEQLQFQNDDELRDAAEKMLQPLFDKGLKPDQVIEFVKNILPSQTIREDFDNLIKAMKYQRLPEAMIMDKVIQFVQLAATEGASYENGANSSMGSLAIIIGSLMAVSLMDAVSTNP